MAANGEIDPQQFGAMRAEVTHLRVSVDRLELSVERLNETLLEMRGGKKILISLASIIAVIAGAVGWLASHIKYSP